MRKDFEGEKDKERQKLGGLEVRLWAKMKLKRTKYPFPVSQRRPPWGSLSLPPEDVPPQFHDAHCLILPEINME